MWAELLDCIAWTWAVLTTPTMLILEALCVVGLITNNLGGRS